MAIKTILEMEIDKDGSFKKFSELFNQFREDLGTIPAGAGAANAGTEKWAKSLIALLEHVRKEQEAADRATAQSGRGFDKMANSTREIALNIGHATASLLRWSSFAGIFTGLAGAGGLFGIDRLAGAVGSGQKESQALGVTYGEKKAFGPVFDRMLENSEGFLHTVRTMQTDVTQQQHLRNAGISQDQIEHQDAAQIAVSLIPLLKKFADNTNPALWGTLGPARFGAAGSAETLSLLHQQSWSRVNASTESFPDIARKLNLGEGDQAAWQDFKSQLSIAGDTIEAVLGHNLKGLAGPLTRLSDAIVGDIAKFTGGGDGASALGSSLDRLAKFVSSQEFEDDISKVWSEAEAMGTELQKVAPDIKDFADAIHDVAEVIRTAIGWMKSADESAEAAGKGARKIWQRFSATWDDIAGRSTIPEVSPSGAPTAGSNTSNPGNIRALGGGFRTFASEDDGVRAIAHQLQRYEDKGAPGGAFAGQKIYTIEKIMETYSPHSENDTERLIRDAVGETGFKRDQPLDLHVTAVLAALVSAITRQEGKHALSKGQVFTIINKAGPSVDVVARSAGQ